MIPRQGTKAAQRARDAIFARDPRCHWCGVTTLHPGKCPPFHKDMATLDHVRPRRECRNFEEYSSPANHVLACLECNQQRDVVDKALMERQREEQARVERLRTEKRRVLIATRF